MALSAAGQPPSPPPRFRDYLVLHSIVLAWGLTAILGKLVTLQPLVLTAWRTGIAAVAVTAFLLLRKSTVWPDRRTLLMMLGAGLLMGLHWFLFFLSARLGTVSGSLAGVSTLPLWVALLEPLLIRGRRWSWPEALLALGVSSGVAVIQFSDRGLLTGILCVGVAAVVAIINSRLVQRHSALIITSLEMTGAFLFCVAGGWLLPALTTGGEASAPEGAGISAWLPAPGDWIHVLTLSLVCTVFAYSACVWVQRRISAFSVGMASNLEPVYGMVLAPLVFGAVEHQPLRFYLGAAVIIGFVILHTWLANRRRSVIPAAAPVAASAPELP